MTPIDNPAEGEDDQGGVVVPLHRGRRKPAPQTPPAPAYNRAADPDPLTGLHGHPWFEEDLRGAARRRRSSENPWVAVAAIEGLTALKNRTGPLAVDEAVRATSICVHDALRSGDKIARIGENRLGLIVDAPFGDEAITALERLERAVRTLAATRREWRELSLSIGLAPLWNQDPAEALQQAVDALERARKPGGHSVQMTTGAPPARSNNS